MANKKTLKWIGMGVSIFIGMLIIKGWLSPSRPPNSASSKNQSLTAPHDAVSGDTTNETLKALTAQVQSVSDQSKQIIARDNQTDAKMNKMTDDLQQQIQTKLQQLTTQNQSAQNNVQSKVKTDVNTKNNLNAEYPVGDTSATTSSSATTNVGLTWIDDMQSGFESQKSLSPHTKLEEENDFHNNNAIPFQLAKPQENPQKPEPRYTIPINSTLYDSISFTGLIGRIPINGVVRDPYPFKVIIGHQNFAANGINIPDIQGIVVGGYAVGDLGMGCVRGNVTSLTFVFPDGRTYTQQATSNASTSANSSAGDGESSLGYLSTPIGNPCINGKYYGNAPEFLMGTMGLGFAQGAANAYSQTQLTNSTNVFGGTTSTVTGVPWKFVAGQAGANGMSAAAQWWAQREQDSFDAIFVPSNQAVVVNITKEIPIDYNVNNRKVFYDISQSNQVSGSLD